jgi:hypothetical protein
MWAARVSVRYTLTLIVTTERASGVAPSDKQALLPATRANGEQRCPFV